MPGLREVGGPRCIPFMQVILMLTTDLDGNEERDCATFDRLLTVLITELSIQDVKTTEEPSQRSSLREFQLVILRLFRFVFIIQRVLISVVAFVEYYCEAGEFQ